MSFVNPVNELVISSRVRLARNLADAVFPSMLDTEDGLEVTKHLAEPLADFRCVRLRDVDDVTCGYYKERHLISQNLIDHRAFSGVCFNKNETAAVMLNEEDHVRIQAILPGFSLMSAYELADKIDNQMNARLEFAYTDTLGYLTSCPTNVGTGMRASVMIFLPALTLTDNMKRIMQKAEQTGIVLRGFYGENTENEGCVYQISNKYSLGLSEDEILSSVSTAIKTVTDAETETMQRHFGNKRDQLTDLVYRAYGVLSNCYMISSKELVNQLVYIRLGAIVGLLSVRDVGALNTLMVKCRPCNLMVAAGKHLSENDRDIARAALSVSVMRSVVSVNGR